MRILMLTNTFTPHVGGVARSVETLSHELRKMGHRVLVVAPEFEGRPEDEEDVVRVPAIQKFNGSDFSLRLALPGYLTDSLDEFRPEIAHSHHPFLMGDSALRIAAVRDLPLLFTHHTMYEQYTHYVPGDSPALQRFVVQLSVGYANLTNQVIAPSESVASILAERGVETPISVIPTGVDLSRFVSGDRAGFRAGLGIPPRALVVGHVGRLAPEKNLRFLSRAVARFLSEKRQFDANEHAVFLVVGSGPSAQEVEGIFRQHGLSGRLHLAGPLEGRRLADAYHAMDIFAFASRSETQGMVLTEAMAAGVPVVALDAPGAREVVHDRVDGRLLPREDSGAFTAALRWVASRPPEERRKLQAACRRTARSFSLEACAERVLYLYERTRSTERLPRAVGDNLWSSAVRLIEAEWELWVNFARAARGARKKPEVGGRKSEAERRRRPAGSSIPMRRRR